MVPIVAGSVGLTLVEQPLEQSADQKRPREADRETHSRELLRLPRANQPGLRVAVNSRSPPPRPPRRGPPETEPVISSPSTVAV